MVVDNSNLKKQTISGLVYKFAERILAQLASTLISIILARILIPEDYGIISIVLIFINFLDVFVESGLGTALIQKKDSDQKDYSSVFWFGLLISILMYIFTFFASSYIALWCNESIIEDVLKIMGIRIPFAAVNSVQHAYAYKNFMFSRFFWATLSGTVISGIFGIVIAVLGYGIWALVVQYLSNVIINTVCLWISVGWRPNFYFSIKRFIGLFSFGWKVLLSGLLTSIYEEIRSFIIAGKYSTADLSFYTKGQQFPKLLANTVGTTITNVMFPVFSIVQDDMQYMKQIVRKSMKMCCYIMFPIMFGFSAIARNFIIVVLTAKWLPMSEYVYLFCLFYIFKPIKVINQSSLKALGKSGLYLIMNICEKMMGIIFIFLTMDYGPVYLAIGAVFTYAIMSIFEALVNGKCLRYTIGEQIADVIPSILISIVMFTVISLMNQLEINYVLLMILQVIIGFFVYFLLSYLFKIESYFYIIKLIKTYVKEKK